jgi:hypothetical protein
MPNGPRQSTRLLPTRVLTLARTGKEAEYLAKEADSLERARHASDEGLKHLHETIAKQWRRLAEGAAGSHADTSTSSNEVRNANSVNDTIPEAPPSTPRARRVETPLEWLLSCWFGSDIGRDNGSGQ